MVSQKIVNDFGCDTVPKLEIDLNIELIYPEIRYYNFTILVKFKYAL